MRDRITIKHLQGQCRRLNILMQRPTEGWRMEKGIYVANVGHYYIDQAYGGYSLEEITNENGAVTLPLSTGHIKARDLYDRINAFMEGIKVGYAAAKREEGLK